MSSQEEKIDTRRDPEGSAHRRGNTTPVQRSQARWSRRPEHRGSPIPRGNMPPTEGERYEYGRMPFGDYDPNRRGNTTPVQRSQAQRSRRPEYIDRAIPRGNMPLSEDERSEYGSMPFDDYDPVGLRDATPIRLRYPVGGRLHQPHDVYEGERLRQQYPPYGIYPVGEFGHRSRPDPRPPLFGYGMQATAPRYFNPQGPYLYPYHGPPSFGYGMQGIAPEYFDPQGGYGMPFHHGPSYHGFPYPWHPRDYENGRAWERRLDANGRRYETIRISRQRQARARSPEFVPADNIPSAKEHTSSDPPTYEDPPAYEDKVGMPTTKSRDGKGLEPRNDEHRRRPFYVSEDESRANDLAEASASSSDAASEAQARPRRRRKPATKRTRVPMSQARERKAFRNDQWFNHPAMQDSTHVEESRSYDDDQSSGQSAMQDSTHREERSRDRCSQDKGQEDTEALRNLVSGLRGTHIEKRARYKCDNAGCIKSHLRHNCALPWVCLGCGRPGHTRMTCKWHCSRCKKQGHMTSRCDFFRADGHLSKSAVDWKRRMAKRWEEELQKPPRERVDPTTATAVNTKASSAKDTKAQPVSEDEWKTRMAEAQELADSLKPEPSTRKWADLDSDSSDSDPSDSENETPPKGEDDQHDRGAQH